jgi:hypothetical protein
MLKKTVRRVAQIGRKTNWYYITKKTAISVHMQASFLAFLKYKYNKIKNIFQLKEEERRTDIT